MTCSDCGADLIDPDRPILGCGRITEHPEHVWQGLGLVTTTPKVHIHRPAHTCNGGGVSTGAA